VVDEVILGQPGEASLVDVEMRQCGCRWPLGKQPVDVGDSRFDPGRRPAKSLPAESARRELGAAGGRRTAERELAAGGREANVHVVVVVRVWDHDAGRPVEPGRIADEDHLRSGGDEAVEKILGERAIDLVG
jgi:hypothetical protein